MTDAIVPVPGPSFDFTQAMHSTQEVETPGIWCLDPETGDWWLEPLTEEEAARFDEAVASAVTIHCKAAEA